jgi:hypothetical protein
MSEANRVTQVRAGKGATESKGGKGKAEIRRNKAGESRRQPDPGAKDPKVIESIRQRAYLLFLAAGCEHGHDLEHWFEAERQITG